MKNQFIFLLSIYISLMSHLSYASDQNDTIKSAVVADINAMLIGDAKAANIEHSSRGIYIKSMYCQHNAIPLEKQLKGQLAIKQDRALIKLFEQILCAPQDNKNDIALSQFSKNMYDPISFETVMYFKEQALGQWSLTDSLGTHKIALANAKISLLGLQPNRIHASTSFWQSISPTHILVWYGPFKLAPADAITFEFKYENKIWKLTRVWNSSHI